MCNKCNNTKHCGCEETNICGCPTKVDLKCLYYDGITLDPLNIIKGMNGEQILQTINDYIKYYLTCLEETPTIISSVGNKIEVYKGLSDEYVHEIKSLFNGDGIKIEDKGDYVEISIDEEWFTEHIIEVFETTLFQTFFINYLQNIFDSSLWTTFISQYLQNLFNSALFNSYFSNYITDLIENGSIDICRLIKKCDSSHDYYINGNVEYNVPNGVVNFNLIAQDFIDKYYDELGHSLVSVKITSGNLQGFMKGNGQPLQLNDIIPISEVNNVTFTANNQSSPYTVSIGFVGINSNNEIVS